MRLSRYITLFVFLVLTAVACNGEAPQISEQEGELTQIAIVRETKIAISDATREAELTREATVRNPPVCNYSGNSTPVIKANINREGERIYHTPSGPASGCYPCTEINPEYGERWFCTEEQAISAGWRRSSAGANCCERD